MSAALLALHATAARHAAQRGGEGREAFVEAYLTYTHGLDAPYTHRLFAANFGYLQHYRSDVCAMQFAAACGVVEFGLRLGGSLHRAVSSASTVTELPPTRSSSATVTEPPVTPRTAPSRSSSGTVSER